MRGIRIESVAEPFASDADLTWAAARLISKAVYLGVVPAGLQGARELGRPLLLALFERLGSLGVAGHANLLMASAVEPDDYRKLLADALEHVEHSPMPEGEWPVLSETLGEELLAALLGVSVSSLRRYSRGTRRTPDDVAARLHFLAMLVSDLAGAYNEYGIRRWFQRPRAALDGRAPRDLLGADLDLDGAHADRLRELAAGLRAAGAT